MTEQTIDAPPLEAPPAAPERAARSSKDAAREIAYRYRWVLAAIGLLLLSLIVVLWARARPGYDPYGWMVWGKLTIHLKLDTNGAPSWKPLPFLFTVPYAFFGHYQLWLWMVTSVAVSLSGIVFAWRIAFRLTDARPERRYAAYAAGLFAGLFLLGIMDFTTASSPYTYVHYILSSESDTMIVSLVLAAIDCQLSGRPRWAFWLWILAALGRPEALPFLALYSIWMWGRRPQDRLMVALGLLLIPLMWIGIPAVTSKSPFTAGNLANNSPREVVGNKISGTLRRFVRSEPWQVEVAALITVIYGALAVWRQRPWPTFELALWCWRPRVKLPTGAPGACVMMAAGAILWVVIEVAFALHGWPAVTRYMFEPAGVMCVLAGAFVGRVVHDVPGLVARTARRITPRRITPHLAGLVGAWGTVILIAVFAGSMLPAAHQRVTNERKELTHERQRTQQIGRLGTVVGLLGASRIVACGQPDIAIGYQSQLAWYLDVKIGSLYVGNYELAHLGHPLVHFREIANGWQVYAQVGPTASKATRARCSGLLANYTS